MIKTTPVQHRMTADHSSARGVEDDEVLKHMQKDTSDGDEQSEDTAVTPTSHQEDPIQSTSQSANEMQQPVSQIPQTDLTPIARFPTNQGQSKCLANAPANESLSKRKWSLSPKLWSAPTPSTGCKYMIKTTPVQHRMTAGHFSAWRVEDDEVLKHMQKDTSDGDEQSEDTAVTPTSHQEAPKSPQHLQNSSNNCVNQENTYTISPFRAIATKDKPKHFATWMRSNSKTNPKTLFYAQLDNKLLNASETCLPKESNNCDEESPPISPEMWICDTCSFSNKASLVRCRMCDVLKYGVITQSYKRIQSKEMSTNKCNVNKGTVATQLIASAGGVSTSSESTETRLPDITPPHQKPRPVGNLMGKWAQRKYLKEEEGDCLDPEFTCPTRKTTNPDVLKAFQSILQQPIIYNWARLGGSRVWPRARSSTHTPMTPRKKNLMTP
ncbi:uncharacterized protein LOC144680442 [Cetorhinus maximus]